MGNSCCSHRGNIKFDKVKDASELNMITAFEQTFPLRKIDINEYSRRLKKLIDINQKDIIT